MVNPFLQTPIMRRLERDLREMEELRSQSSILEFEAKGAPANEYLVTFRGKGLAGTDKQPIISEFHQARIYLGGSYPYRIPRIVWETPILHPNIKTGGAPCFGGFAMTPAVRLVDLIEIMWDMTRMAVFNTYTNLEADNVFQALRRDPGFPVDFRILRDRVPRAPEEGGPPEILILGAAAPPRNAEWTKRAIEQYLVTHELANDSRVYTQEEWRARNEKYGNDAPFTITTEGNLFDLLNRGDWPGAAAEIEEWNAFLDSLGLWWDLGYAWSVHLYAGER